MMAVARPGYPYAAAIIRSVEGGLFTTQRLQRMVEAADAEEAFKILKESSYGSMVSAENAHEYEALISAELEKASKLISQISPDEAVTDVFISQWDYHNAKTLIKMKGSGSDDRAALIEAGKVPVSELEDAVFQGDYGRLPRHLSDAIAQTNEAIKQKPDPRRVDTIMDKCWMNWALTEAQHAKGQLLTKYLTAYADLGNLIAFIRVRTMGEGGALLSDALLPGGRISIPTFIDAVEMNDDAAAARIGTTFYGKKCADLFAAGLSSHIPWELEKFRDDYLTSLVKANRWEHFTIEPVVAYYLAKQSEAKAIRMVMVGKINNIETEILSERLREMYV